MKKILFALLVVAHASSVMAACEVVDGGKKTPFDGKVGTMSVEKKSLSILNKEFPDLNIVEKSFKGEVQTCSSCSDKYITCSN